MLSNKQSKSGRLIIGGVVFALSCFALYYVSYINRQPNYAQMERDAAHRYNEKYNKFQPNEKLPDVDFKMYGLIKRDGRYFAIPKEYAGHDGFAFFWPSKIPYSLYKNGNEVDERKSLIEVYMESSRSPIGIQIKKLNINDKNFCSQNVYTAFYWNNIVVWMRFAKKTHEKEWLLICQETIRILYQVKEVK